MRHLTPQLLDRYRVSRFENTAGQEQIDHRTQRVKIIGLVRWSLAVAPFRWCKSRCSPRQIIGLIDARSAFEIDRHQTAVTRDDDVIWFAIAPDPARVMHLRDEVCELQRIIQNPSQRQTSLPSIQDAVQSFAVEVFHYQVVVSVLRK